MKKGDREIRVRDSVVETTMDGFDGSWEWNSDDSGDVSNFELQ